MREKDSLFINSSHLECNCLHGTCADGNVGITRTWRSSLTLSMGATAVSEIAAAIPPAKKSLANEIAVSLMAAWCCWLYGKAVRQSHRHNRIYRCSGTFLKPRSRDTAGSQSVLVHLYFREEESKPDLCSEIFGVCGIRLHCTAFEEKPVRPAWPARSVLCIIVVAG